MYLKTNGFAFRHCVIACFVFLVISAAARAASLPEEVVVAVGHDSVPYYFLDEKSKPAGLVVDIWKLWSERTGIRVRFKALPFGDTLAAVKEGRADIQAGCFYNEERAKYLDYVSPVVGVKTHFFFRRNIFGVKQLDDLRGFRIGIIKGDAAIEFLKKKMPKASLAVYPDNLSLFEAVRTGDIVAFVKDTNIALAMLAKYKIQDQFRYYEQDPLYAADWFCAVKKGNGSLADIVKRGMAAISPSETSAIVRHWTGTDGGIDGDTLTIALSKDYPPMSMISASGKPSGMLVDFWRLWAKKTRRKIAFRFFDWEASLAAVETGEADIHSGLFKTLDREARIGFSKPFYQVESGFFHRRGPLAAAGIKDLTGLRVGVEAGTQQLSFLKETYKQIRVVSVPSDGKLLEAAQGDRFDAFFAELPYVLAQLERRGEQGMFALLPDGRMTRALHAGVARGNPGLIQTVNQGLAAISPAELADIEARWIRDPALRQLGTDALVPMLSAAEKEWLKSHQVIPILGESDWPPLDFAGPDGQYKGVAADYVGLIARRLGIRFEVVTDYAWNQMIELAKAGKTAGITCIAKRKDREAYLKFTRPYFVCPYVIVARRDGARISGIQDLYDKKVAIESGYFLHAKLTREYPEVVPLPVKNTLDALKAVQKGAADAYIGNLMVVKHLFRENGIIDLKVASPSPWPGSKLRMGIRKDWPLLVSAIDKAIDSIPPEAHREINRKWMEGGTGQAGRTGIRFSPKEEAWLSGNKVVVVAGESGWPPVSFTDGQGAFQGITADYLDLLSGRTGLRMEIITDYSWDQMVGMAKKKQVDVISAIVENDERKAFLSFTEPYFVSPYVVVTRKSHPRIDSLEEVAQGIVAVEKGFSLHRRLKADYPDQRLMTTQDTLSALEAVSRKKADAYVGNLMVIRYLIRANRIKNLKVACPAPWPGSRLRLGVRKDWPVLTGILNKALADITAEEHQAVNRRWMDYTPGRQGAAVKLSRVERAWLDDHPDIRLGVDPGWPPFEFISKKNRYAGLASEYIRRIEDALGITMRVEKGLSWTQALEKGQEGKIDLFPCITPSPERSRFLSFTRPYLTFPMVIAARTDFPFISALTELEGKTVAVVKGYVSHEILKRDHKDLILEETDTVSEALERVSRGRADAFVGNLASITYYSKQMGLTNIKIAAVTPYSFNLSIGVRKDWPELVSILNKTLDAIPESEKNEIRNSWISMRFEHGVNWSLLWKWIIGMALVSGTILSIILYSNRKLKMEVAERKRVETALREAEAHSRLILESVGEGIIGQDAEGACTFINPAALEMLGYEGEEILGRQVHETIHHTRADQTPYPFEECAMCRAGIQSSRGTGDEVIWRKDGSSFDARYSSNWLRNSGEAAGSVIVFRDITYRKKAEEQLRKLYKAVEQSPVSVIITDPQGNIEYVNPTFSQVTGYTSLDVLGQNPRILKTEHTPEAVYKEMWETIAAGKVWQGEFRNRKKTGELFWEAANISPIVSGNDEITHYLCVKEDITRRKEMEANLLENQTQLEAAVALSKREKRRAEAADRAKSEFLANMSHEIRTPMNAIIGMTHLALQTDLNSRQLDYVEKIDASAKSLLGLINDILDFSKIEAGKLSMENLEFSLDEILDRLAGLIAVRAGEKDDLEVLFRVDPETPDRLMGDPLRLNQVLVNLGNNAVKFTEKGHIIVGVEVLEKTAGRVVLKFSVTDTGIGMTPDQKNKLFKAFSQGDTSTTRKYGGTGLGLIISKRIVEMMDGEISLESEAGRGSTFSFTVPMAVVTGTAPERPPLDEEMAAISVLVIDDNPVARQIFMEMLASMSLEAKSAGSGAEGIAMVEDERPDLVLVDMAMPGMNGLETARAIKEITPGGKEIKIVLVCAKEDETLIALAGEMALNGVLVKPASHSGLFNAVVGAFGREDTKTRLVSRKKTGSIALSRKILGARILVVEDHDINQQVAKEILEGAGFWTKIAEDGEQGLSMALSQEFDLVLMDLQMPVMDGYEAARQIRLHKSAQDLPIIAMTASAMPKDRERALAFGMNAHVSKPIDLNELFRALSTWIKPGDRPLPEGFARKDEAGTFLADVPGIAVASALVRLDRNQDLFLKLLDKFRRDYAAADKEMEAMLAEGETEAAMRLAHSVKGVAGNIGMTDVQAGAEKLETACREQALSAAPDLLAAFSGALSQALSSLALLARGAEEDPGEEEPAGMRQPEELAAMLEELVPFVREREAKPAKEKVKQITACRWPDDLATDVRDLGRLISGYRFKAAGELMEKLVTKLESV